MKITKRELIKMGACKPGLRRFIEQTNDTDELVDVASLVGGKNTLSDLTWLASKKVPKEHLLRFSCDCALINIKLIKPYTNKYELIVKWLENPTTDAAAAYAAAAYAAAANAATDAAYAAAYAANAAANAAYAADAYAAANAAAYAAAYAAANAAYAADAYAAANAAADDDDDECGERINELLIEMFNKVGE
jgi:hypothetical protein